MEVYIYKILRQVMILKNNNTQVQTVLSLLQVQKATHTKTTFTQCKKRFPQH